MTAAPSTEDLVRRLVTEAQPVRPFAAPWRQALVWQAAAVLLVAVAVGMVGLRPDIGRKLGQATYYVELAASLVTGVGGAFAVFYISLPDRSTRWTWVPVVPALVWFATLGVDCFGDVSRLGSRAFMPAMSEYCLYTMLIVSVPLGGMLITMLRHVGRVRPYRTLALAAMSLSGFCCTGLSLFHHIDTGVSVFVWHFGSAALVALIWLGPGAGLVRRRLDREAQALREAA